MKKLKRAALLLPLLALSACTHHLSSAGCMPSTTFIKPATISIRNFAPM